MHVTLWLTYLLLLLLPTAVVVVVVWNSLSLAIVADDAAAAAVVFSTLPQKPKTWRFGFRCLFVCLAFVFVSSFFFCNKFCLKTRRRRRCRRIFFNLRDPYPPPFFPLQVREKICSDLFFFVVVSTLLLFCYSRRERERSLFRFLESFLRRKKKSKSKGISIDVREKN